MMPAFPLAGIIPERARAPAWTRVDSLPSFIADLNEAQRRAVESTEGPVLVLAGAGSGKTRVIIYRIGYLLARGLARPDEIVSVTFTNKASGEMRSRVETLLGSPPEGLNISTFHALGVRILRREAERLGYRTDFLIYDAADQLALMKECLREIQVSEQNFPPRSILTRVGAAKTARLSATQMPRRDYLDEIVGRAYEVYDRRLREANAFDFDDLILKPLDLLESSPELAERLSRRIRYLLIDEYQDTDRAQYLLVRALSRVHGNLCVVGDEDQSIYRWRGADIRNILDFERDFPDAQTIKLEKNYRSTGMILEAAGAVIERNQSRIGKRLWTDNPRGKPIEIMALESDLEEARAIVQRLVELQSDPELSGAAVLYRTNSQSRVLEEALVARGIAYRILGALRFYDRKEIKDLLAYLKFTVNPDADVSLRRILNVPPRSIGGVAVTALELYAGRKHVSLGRALESVEEADSMPSRARDVLGRMAAMVRSWRADLDSLPVASLMSRIVRDTRYVEYLEKTYAGDAEERAANLEELRRVAEESGTGAEGLQFFLDRAALVSDTDDLKGKNGVTLLTLHSAKGLEFPVVFISGMEEGLFPHARAFDSEEEMEEERRLCYVGFTRARWRLILTHALRRLVHGVPTPQEPSRFLSEVPSGLTQVNLPAMNAAGSHVSEWKGSENFSSGVAAVAPGRRTGGYPSTGYGPAGAAGLRRGSRRRSSQSDPVKVGVVFGAADWGTAGSTGGFPPGARVEHPMFGQGQVETAEGSGERLKLTIRFSGYGRKKILPHFAALRRIG
ncbi:MAG: UvrD-helicase domain-containing protein [Acidobacteria bacterium]|nr:UvrD-helicase domain-containing protein [Acidobacteriota bacterium]